MYNLNYNVTNCRLNKPAGRPFVPFGRPDPFSGSLVLAIPGAIFRQGYVNVFNQINEFDDISGYLKGDAVFNEDTAQYEPAYVSHTITPTGTNGFVGPSSLTNFIDDGYETSLIVSGNMALLSNQLSSSLGTDFNLSTSSAWTIEAWVAFDRTASLIQTSSSEYPDIPLFVGQPNKIFMSKWFTDNPSGSSYISYVGWSGKVGNFPGPIDSFATSSGVPTFYYDFGAGGNPDVMRQPTYQNVYSPLQWQHTAITCYPSASAARLHFYIDGQLIGSSSLTNQIRLAPETAVMLLGNPNPTVPPPYNAINNSNYATGSGLFVQDFRFYNGAAKYTGSSFTPPESMIVGKFEPYPQYNP